MRAFMAQNPGSVFGLGEMMNMPGVTVNVSTFSYM